MRGEPDQPRGSAPDTPAKKVQSAGMEYGYPHGHLGRLTESEVVQFEAFKRFLEQKELYTAGPPPSHDDPTLLYVCRCSRIRTPLSMF